MNRTFDLVIWGASGFTGRLVVEYLHRQYGNDTRLRWAVGGRNAAKIQQLLRERGIAEVPILIADSHDRASLEQMAAQTRVLCATVGPYTLYGEEVLAACVSQGTHYCDLTGEVPWMRRMIDRYHEQAQQQRVRIVHTCGFDSIPSDMGVYFLQKQAKEQLGDYCQHIRFRLKKSQGGLSGGTAASLMQVMAEADSDPRVGELLDNPYALNPSAVPTGPDGPDLMQLEFDPITDAYIGPFIMSSINTRVVRRSHALQGLPYGANFRYDEAMLTGKGISGRIVGGLISTVMGQLMQARPTSWMGKLMGLLLPKPGQGPSEQERENGFYLIDLYGTLPDGRLCTGRIKGDKDPGYGSTSKMLTECAICLAKDDLQTPFGLLTPSVAMGDALLKRLQASAGLTFTWKGVR